MAEFGPLAPLRMETWPDGEVNDSRRNKEGRDAAGSFFEQVLVLALDDFESADAAADVDADLLRRFRR